MRLLSILLLSYFLSACSSNLSKGNNMMEAEQFDEAVSYYEKAMQDDPGDTDVAIKLYEARTRMVMANLIKVRLQRQSNQHRAAAIQLNKSLHNIKRWKIIADSNVKATIEEEVYEGGKWLDKELKAIAKRADHNAFFYTLKQFNYILDAGYADQTIALHKPKLQQQGQQQCQSMKAQLTPQSYYLNDVWQAYCGVFALEVKYRLAKDSTRYSQPNISAKGLRASKDAGISGKQIAQYIERAIQQHPWFSNQASAPLGLNMSGRIQYDVSSHPKTFTSTVMVYDETLELIKDPKDSKKVIRKLIQKKKVPKTVRFKGLEYEEVYSHSISVQGQVKGSAINALNQAAQQKSLLPSHNSYFKDQGIKPLKVIFKNKQAWQNQIANGLTQQINQDLDQAWIQQFCTDQGIDKTLSKHENIVRCSILKPEHALVNAWSLSEFALEFNQLNIMLGRDL